MTDSILIVGTGALANLFAARLAAAGVGVTMLGSWPEGLAALRQDGVRLGDQVYPVIATADPADCAGARLALVLVKSWQTERAARQLAECLAPDGIALTLQNGLGNNAILQRYLGAERSGAGVTTTGATLLGPGHVRPGGEGIISLGQHPRLGKMIQLLRDSDFSVEVAPDLESLTWSKLLINVAINPLTALLRVPNGQLLEIPSARNVITAAVLEVARVAQSKNISLTFDDPVAAAEDVAHRTAANRSSMLQDTSRGAPTEIDAICGAVVAAGEECGIPTPVNRTLWQLVRALIST
ncbi:MAG: 2-dehydropantoate 2-reductase [Chloroflexota bacterium]|nr:2-dehydropantoate 2-reductase [Chloroflexota bacterium]